MSGLIWRKVKSQLTTTCMECCPGDREFGTVLSVSIRLGAGNKLFLFNRFNGDWICGWCEMLARVV